jgi:hypothetical protein
MTLERSSNPILQPSIGANDQKAVGYRVPTTPQAIALQLRRRENAADAIGELTHNLELYIVTKGQFSLIDAIRVLLNQTGPADLIITTWTAHGHNIEETAGLLADGKVRSARFLIDHTFQRRKAHFCGQIRAMFGDDAIRITKNHAKLVVISNEKWKVNILTSMNLNQNLRLEYLLIRESPELAAFNESWISEIFKKKPSAGQFEQTHAFHEHAFEDE